MKKFFCALCTCLFVFTGCKSSENKTEYKINCQLIDNKLLCQMDVTTYAPTKTDEIWFNLFFNAYRENAEYFAIEKELLPSSPRYGQGQIISVKGGLGYEVCQDQSILKVYLNKKHAKGERIDLKIEFSVLLSNFNHRLSSGEQTVNLGNFFPILCVWDKEYKNCPYYDVGDPFYSTVANYLVEITCSGDYSVASSGQCQSVKIVDDKTTYCYRVNDVRDFALVLSKDYYIVKSSLNGVEIYYYYLSEKNYEDLKLIKNCLNFFSQTFYEYPYKTYSVVQADFCYGGMEYPCLSLINKNLSDKERLWTIVHETAHQWWYGIVGNDQINQACLDEGLAEYSTGLFFSNFSEYGIVVEQDLILKANRYANFKALYKTMYGNDYDFSPKRALREYVDSTDYVNSVYLYTPYFLTKLSNAMGAENFSKLLGEFAKKYAYKTANVQNFIQIFSGPERQYLTNAYKGFAVCE